MSVLNYRQRWLDLQNTAAGNNTIGRLARQIAASFLDEFLKDGGFGEEHISLLCEMSTRGRDPQADKAAAQALFGIIIERLCDEFEELPSETYKQVMAQVLSFCRRLPAGAALDQRMAAAGIHTRAKIVERIDRIGRRDTRLNAQRTPEKIFVLSRVTVGADVAVTSIILQRMAAFFPGAELVLIGPRKCEEIFSGWKRLTIAPIKYRRSGGLFARLDSWHQAHEIISANSRIGAGGHMILIDPDSRISQLGLLPLAPDEDYFYFNSRSAAAEKKHLSIGALANSWLDHICGETRPTHPGVWPRSDCLRKAAAFCDRLRSNGARRLIAINFGVGGNPRKKVGRQFERALLQRLLREKGTVILLDKGSSAPEAENIAQLMDAIGNRNHQVHAAAVSKAPPKSMDGGVLGLQMGIGELAALISNCDEYIGYDSAGQHIAAALKVPCITVFAGSNSMRFVQRWAAQGPGERHIVHADTLTNPGAVDIEDIIGRVIAARSRQ